MLRACFQLEVLEPQDGVGRKQAMSSRQKATECIFPVCNADGQLNRHLEDLFTNVLSLKDFWVNYRQTHSQRVKILHVSAATVFSLSQFKNFQFHFLLAQKRQYVT